MGKQTPAEHPPTLTQYFFAQVLLGEFYLVLRVDGGDLVEPFKDGLPGGALSSE
jgi:hypothetical protein